jgi:hypothetical protein
MSNWFGRWFAYGAGAKAWTELFAEDPGKSRAAGESLPQQTEAEIQEAEKRYDEDEKRIEAAARAERESHA